MTKCKPGCTCKRHSHPGGSAKCKPGCTCKKHEAKGRKNPHPEGCQCSHHKKFTKEELLDRGRKISAAKRGEGHPGKYLLEGYVMLLSQHSHPLADEDGKVYEHRKVLYDKIGPGPHECHWGCGKLLDWGGVEGVCVDHLDGDKENNSEKNLVPSCLPCNWSRHTNIGEKKEKSQ